MKIKSSLLFCFMVWMQRGHHKLGERKGKIIMKKGNNVAIVDLKDTEYVEANSYCLERYKVFLKHWFNSGKDILSDLYYQGKREVMHNRKCNYVDKFR